MTTKPAPKQLTEADTMRAALKMPDREAADLYVAELAKKTERDEGYCRWWIVQWAVQYQPDQQARARELYEAASPQKNKH